MTPTTTTAPNRRRKAVALLLGLGIAGGLTAASAASLGGITAKSLGADVNVVASCDTNGVTVAFTNSYSSTTGKYMTSAVTVSGIDASCAGKTMDLTLVKDPSVTKVSIGTGTVTLPATGFTGSQVVTLSTAAAADSVEGVAIVIAG